MDVTVEIEIDEPDQEKAEHWAEEFVEKCLHHIAVPYVEEYDVASEPYVKEVCIEEDSQ